MTGRVRLLLSLLTPFAGPAALLAGPQEALAAAAADARALLPEVARQTRYLAEFSVWGEDVERLRAACDFSANCRSTEVEIAPLRRLPGGLLAVYLPAYGWPPELWERLAKVEPYFHVTVEVPYGYYRVPGDKSSWVTTRVERKVAAAPWLDKALAAELIARTGSEVPLVRADWWFAQTMVQAGRVAGYYDWLGVKDRKSFEALVGLDRDLARRMRQEVAAIVADSGVTLNNRQIYRFDKVGGSWWETRDVKEQTGERNALRRLNGDYAHDAEEVFANLPNGLFAYGLFDAQGNRQDSAPDFIASDGTSTSNDRRVHAGLSCVRCHAEGLRPIDDWARKTYRGGTLLVSPDPEKFRRLRQLYLLPLERWRQRDNADYAEALLRVNGLSPAQNAAAVAWLWEFYVDTPVTLAQAARECGVPDWELAAALGRALRHPPADPVPAALARGLPVRREHFEEAFSSIMAALAAYRAGRDQ